MTIPRDAVESSTDAARRRVEARLRSAGVALPAMPPGASEDERARAAIAALEALQPRRAKAFAESRAVGGADTVAAPAPVPAPASTPASARVRPRAPRIGAGERIGSRARVLLLPCAVAAIAGVTGFVFARASQPPAAASTSAVAAAPVVPLASSTPATPATPVVSLARTGSPGPSANADALLADNLRLQRALVTAETELSTLRGASGRADVPADDYLADRFFDDSPDDPLGDPLDDSSGDPDRAEGGGAPRGIAALAGAGFDEAELQRVSKAVADADAELGLIELGSGDPSADPVDLARARLAARTRLLDAIGVDAFVAARGARGEPNRVALSAVPGGSAYAALQVGDALLAIDGRPAFDADDVTAADGPGSRELMVLRRGERTSVTVDAPLSALDVDTDSLPGWAWIAPEVDGER